MITAGIDAGSRTIKVVLFDNDHGTIVASGFVDQGIEQNRLAQNLLSQLLTEHNLTRHDIQATVATGYGRKLIEPADTTVTPRTYVPFPPTTCQLPSFANPFSRGSTRATCSESHRSRKLFQATYNDPSSVLAMAG